MDSNANRGNELNNEQDLELENIFYEDDDLVIYKDELQELIHSNERKNKMNSLITKIIDEGNCDAFSYLIKEGYELNVMNDNGETAIHLAYRNSYHKMLQPDKGKLLFSCAKDENYVDNKGLSLFHIACDLGHLPRVTSYLNSGVDVNESCDEDTMAHLIHLVAGKLTPLHFAILNHQKQVVNLLLQNGADVNAIDTEERTALHLAAVVDEYHWPSSYEQDMEIMKIFVAYPHLLNAKDNKGNTPLLSVYGNYHYGVEILDSEELSDDLETIVKKIVSFDPRVRKLEKVEMLLVHGADVTLKNNEGNTILHDVINDLAPMRLPWYDPPISFDDDVHADAIQKILTLGRNLIINVENNNRLTPIQLAISHMSPKIVKVLLDHNADITNLQFGHNEDHLFAYHKIVPTLDCVQNTIAMIDLLLEKEFNLTPQDNMQFLKILIHNDEYCSCHKISNSDLNMTIDEIVSLSTPNHVLFLNVKSAWPTKNLKNLQQFFISIEIGKLFLDEEIKDAITAFLNDFKFDPPQIDIAKLEEEITCMKDIKLTKIKSLYDVMTIHPHAIHQYIVNSDYQFLKHFKYYKNLIKGHIAKSLIRHYVEKSAYQYLTILLSSALQYPCYQMIIRYLSNDDIWAVCRAVFPESAYQQNSVLFQKASTDKTDSSDSDSDSWST